MNDVVAYCGIITATDRKHKNKGWHVELVKLLKIKKKILRLPVRFWFKTGLSERPIVVPAHILCSGFFYLK